MNRVEYRVSMGALTALTAFLVLAAPAASVQQSPVRSVDAGETSPTLHGRVTLTDGGVLEGRLTWNGHASTLDDVLEGRRGISEDGLRLRTAVSERNAAERRRSVDLPGVRVTWEEDDPDLARLVQAGIGLHWVESLAPDSAALEVRLHTGEGIRLRSSGRDVGPGFGGLVVEADDGRTRTLDWEEFTRVDLLHDPAAGDPERFRLHGTVETTGGTSLTGWIVWDLDESRAWHRLHGEVEGDDVDIEFSRITRIVKVEEGAGVVVRLRDGRTLVLTGSNDVGPENLGIGVIELDGRSHIVEWAEFESLEFSGNRGGA